MTVEARTGWTSNTAVHVAFGFLMMGGWAMFANRHHPLGDAALAGLVQGTNSGALTLVLKKFLEWINARFTGLPALIAPPLVTATSIFLILFSAHTLAGTPEVAATIAVPFTVSTAYAILYNLRLWRETHGRR
jgi:mannose/fructose/N-acetylgalactosamine-specific phosphotransferase system component IIC